MSSFFRDLDQKDLVDTAKQLHKLGVRREWQELDQYTKETTVTYLRETRPEIFHYRGEYMDAETCYFIPTLEDALAFLLQRNFVPVMEYYVKGKWRLTWTVGGFAEGLTPRIAALRAMEELIRREREEQKKEE
ncbi:MAG: hypothetical protein AB1489_22655 [Acidobacteriota bacterium]